MTKLNDGKDILPTALLNDASAIIEQTRANAYRAVNTFLTIRNWLIGNRISHELLDGNERAQYGRQVIKQLAFILTDEYGKGFDFSSLNKYVRFYRLFPEIIDSKRGNFSSTPILDSLSPKFQFSDIQHNKLLPWTHYRELIRVEDNKVRKWYEQEALREGWSVRTLHRNIGSQYYHRLLHSVDKQSVKDEMHRLTSDFQNQPQDFIKNPVVTEFLGLSPQTSFTESNLETAIINHIQQFVMELGKGYAFVARQQNIRTDMGDFFIDLVFYNYILKCFLLIDLKTGPITHQDVGQMDMYVRMYDELKRTQGDNPTIGLVLCSDTSADMARYSVLRENDRLFQAKYLTCLPTEEELRYEIERQKEIFMLQQDQRIGS